MSDTIDDLFGEPALLLGEDKERYMRLYAAVEADIQPKDFFGRMQVREQTDKIWEELRLKRCSAALIDSAYIKALAELLDPLHKQKVFLKTAAQAALEFYGPNDTDKKKIAAIMAVHGITELMIQAKAMQILGGTIQMLDRMIISRENSRRSLRKEQEKREATSYPRNLDELREARLSPEGV